MNDIDKFCAEQCGIEISAEPLKVYGYEIVNWSDLGLPRFWSIKDPRCREIVREHFDISTQRHYHRDGQLIWYSDKFSTSYDGYGITIEEAEIECITAIWEASK